MLGGHHEVAIFQGTGPEAEESEQDWRECKKNPLHERFLPVPDFVDNYLPGIQDVEHRKYIEGLIDCTVRLRVNYTSLDRPKDDDFSKLRGQKGLRVGTGCVENIWEGIGPLDNKPCQDFRCGEKVTRRHWVIGIRTAHHVVYNTEEAKTTQVDFFYDDKDSDIDGRMKSLWGLEVVDIKPYRDFCLMTCVTSDEGLVKRIKPAKMEIYKGVFPRDLKENLRDLGLFQSCHEDCGPVLIVSHPHGQPKQITVGEWKYKDDFGRYTRRYTTPTCPVSSGATVVRITEHGDFFWPTTIHSGSFDETSTERHDRPRLLKRLLNKLRGQETQTSTQQHNYGHDWL